MRHTVRLHVYGCDYLLTWNCTHIANAAIRSDIELSSAGVDVESASVNAGLK